MQAHIIIIEHSQKCHKDNKDCTIHIHSDIYSLFGYADTWNGKHHVSHGVNVLCVAHSDNHFVHLVALAQTVLLLQAAMPALGSSSDIRPYR